MNFHLVVCRSMAQRGPDLDDQFGRCHRCHARIRFRPDPPPGPKACPPCALIVVGANRKPKT